MKKIKIIDVVFILFFSFVIINTITSYLSYKQLQSSDEPTVKFGIKKEDNKIIYNELLYKITVEEKEFERTVSLKLFFLN